MVRFMQQYIVHSPIIYNLLPNNIGWNKILHRHIMVRLHGKHIWYMKSIKNIEIRSNYNTYQYFKTATNENFNVFIYWCVLNLQRINTNLNVYRQRWLLKYIVEIYILSLFLKIYLYRIYCVYKCPCNATSKYTHIFGLEVAT